MAHPQILLTRPKSYRTISVMMALAASGGAGACGTVLGLDLDGLRHLDTDASSPEDKIEQTDGASLGDYAFDGNAFGHDASVGDAACTDCDPSDVATGMTAVGAIAVDDANVYFVETKGARAGVYRCAKVGCGDKATLLAPGRLPNRLHSDGATLFWVHNGVLESCAVSGCSLIPNEVTKTDFIVHSAYHGRHAFIVTRPQGALKVATLDLARTPLDLELLETIVDDVPYVRDIAASAEGVAWATDKVGIRFVTMTEAATFSAAASLDPSSTFRLTMRGKSVYFMPIESNALLSRCDLPVCSPKRVIAPGVMAFQYGTDDAFFYWSRTDGSIVRCSLAGCGGSSPEVLVGKDRIALEQGDGLALDAHHLYYQATVGVRRVKK